MSSQSPRRRPSPAVYRRRRLAVLLLALLVVGGIVALVVWQPWRAMTDATSQPAGGSPASASPAPTSSVSPSAAPSEAPTPSATPTPRVTSSADGDGGASDDNDIAACTTGDVTVTATTDKSSYGTGELPNLSITLVNDTDSPCLINVGTAAQTFEVTSGSDTWWRSTDCQTKPSDQIVTLDAGKTVKSAAPIVWDRTRSSVDTCDGDRQKALPGWYNLSVTIGGIGSAEPASFTLR
ncbi:hypothetical protein [Microbacterium oleivorans]|uniref:hypothetical protein n=1 Tax=Microbacterium oleivorans TaxID=273677 RepID=UPI0020CFD471|nr:hypothetical protein [Microbacterium oleivorans]